jgi:ATP-dependent helicase/nuclease subunit A
VSGSEPSRGNNLGWYGQIREQMRRHMNLDELEDDQAIVFQTGEPAQPQERTLTPVDQPHSGTAPYSVETDLKGPFTHIRQFKEIAPSYQLGELPEANVPDEELVASQTNRLDEDKQTKGNVIHRILQLLSERSDEVDIAHWIRAEYGLDINNRPWQQWFSEAKTVISNPDWGFLYDPAQYQKAFNEVPIIYQHNNDTVYGFIDRLVMTDNKILLVDYKTHELQSPQDAENLTARYLPQLHLYQQGVVKCWPDMPVECYLLFTHNAELIPVIM